MAITNGDLIRKVFPSCTDKDIANGMMGQLGCSECPAKLICSRHMEMYCGEVIVFYLGMEANMSEAPR